MLDPGKLENDPAIGMWADREDMRDGVEWVKRLRESEWGGVAPDIDAITSPKEILDETR
jgi:hypothetical protein